MATKTIYFDESGFTGYNLLDPNQAVFTIASADLTNEEAAALLSEVFPRYQGAEYKFANIWGSRRHRSRLVEFGKACVALGGRAFVTRTDKRFAVLTKIVDFLIEPNAHAAGYDFYADGFCWKYANYIHYGLTQFSRPAFYNALVEAYQEFSRQPSKQTLSRLQTRLSIMAASCEDIVRPFVEQMADGAMMFENYIDADNFTGSDELHVTTMVTTVCWWRQRFSEDFAVVHDESAHFFRHRELWEMMTRSDGPVQLHRGGDGSDVEYPLRVASTSAIPSEQSAAVQFCDILAGLSGKLFDPRIDDEDRAILAATVDAGLSSIGTNGLRFEHVFPDEFPPKRLDGPDAVDRMVEQIYGVRFGPEPDVH